MPRSEKSVVKGERPPKPRKGAPSAGKAGGMPEAVEGQEVVVADASEGKKKVKRSSSKTRKRSAAVRKREPRVAIVAGLRTPFARQATAYRHASALELATAIVAELFARYDMDPALVDRVVYGQVMPSLEAPNIAREIVLGTEMDPSTDAFSVSRACATSFQALASLADAIRTGEIEVGLGGGADSASVVPVTVTKRLASALLELSKSKTVARRLAVLKRLKLADLAPVPPSAKEYSTGLTMGEHAEKMAKAEGISREEQDAFAHRSHRLAHAAWEDGRLREEVAPVYVRDYSSALMRDNVIRGDSNLENYARLRPAFDRAHGTITAGNSSPLTDGAACVVVMKEERAKAEGLEPMGYIRGYAFVGLDPADGLLMGPAYATPLALDRAGVTLKDMTLVDMHEAFAAQILCNLRAFGSERFARERLNRTQAIGEIDLDRFNVMGGSIAFGHPFAATGARMITQTLRELRRRGGGLALATACAAGGLGAAMVLEVA